MSFHSSTERQYFGLQCIRSSSVSSANSSPNAHSSFFDNGPCRGLSNPSTSLPWRVSVRLNSSYPITKHGTDVKTVYPLVSGNITGPALNGTILHGAASPEVTDDGVYAFSYRRYYGNTTDGEDFWIEQKGVGHYTREQTWLVISYL